MNSLKSLFTLFEASKVKRMHTRETLRGQNLAAHSWGVAAMVLYVTRDATLACSGLFHDMAELATGDIPGPIKWGNAALEEQLRVIEEGFNSLHGLTQWLTLDPISKAILKACDYMELSLFCTDEMRLGHNGVGDVYERAMAAALQHIDKVPFNFKAHTRLKELYHGIEGKQAASGRSTLQDRRRGTLGPGSPAGAGLLPRTNHEVRRTVAAEERGTRFGEGSTLPGQVHRAEDDRDGAEPGQAYVDQG